MGERATKNGRRVHRLTPKPQSRTPFARFDWVSRYRRGIWCCGQSCIQVRQFAVSLLRPFQITSIKR